MDVYGERLPMWTTKEVSLPVFHRGIFFMGASVLSPVLIFPESFVANTNQEIAFESEKGPLGEDFQSLQRFYRESTRHSSLWISYIGPAGIGQFSLVKEKQCSALTRWDVHIRDPTDEEMYFDFRNFTDQVVGPAVDEVTSEERDRYSNNAVLELSGKRYYFVGPPRIEDSVFATRVFPGEPLKDITALINEVDSISAERPREFQYYRVLHAKEGEITGMEFRDPAEYEPRKMDYLGKVNIAKGVMLFHPLEGGIIDYSNMIVSSSQESEL